jgi:Cu-Zn family superoxide dismutase
MKRFALALVTLVVCAGAQAASDEVEMNLVTSQGVGQSIGTVKITETDKGLEFAPTSKHSLPVNMVSMFMPKAAVSPR